VVTAYGKYDAEVGVLIQNHPEIHESELVYRSLGLFVTLNKETDRCVDMDRCVDIELFEPTESRNPVQPP
jgi:hypothetical protein